MFSFHHVALSVKNLKESIEFYNALGFEKVFEWHADDHSLSMAHLKLNDFLLELFAHQNHAELPQHAKSLEKDLPTIGIKHFALRVPSIENAKRKMLEMNVADSIEIRKGRSSVDYFFVKDPNGIFFEIVQDDRGLVK